MDVPTALLRDLDQLADAGLDKDAFLREIRALVERLWTAVPSARGLRLRIAMQHQPVDLTIFPPAGRDDPIATSLRLPLAAIGGQFDDGGSIVFYAAAPGAFVDLAADLDYVLPVGTPVTLDADLPPTRRTTGITGLTELAAVNRAIGIRIESGDLPPDGLGGPP